MFKKDDAADISNYRPISLLSAPSKIMESCVSDTVVHYVFDHNLITDYQWAYREGYSTELLLAHLSETWRKAVDQNKVVAVASIDFRKLTQIEASLWYSRTFILMADRLSIRSHSIFSGEWSAI